MDANAAYVHSHDVRYNSLTAGIKMGADWLQLFLIERMVAANPLGRAPRIHGELKMLGIEISERTVSRIIRRLSRPPGQTWKTSLHNHFAQIVSIDFFTAPTITLQALFVFIVLEH